MRALHLLMPASLLALIACDGESPDYDSYVTRAEYDDLREDFDELMTRVAELEQQGTDTTDYQGQIDDLTADLTDLALDVSVLDEAAVKMITTDTVYSISADGSGDFTDLNHAFEELQSYSIPSDVTVTIQLGEGTHVYGSRLDLKHRDGDQIQIVGNVDKPESVILDFVGHDGILIEDGYGLGLLQGVSISSDGSDDLDGITVKYGGRLRVSDIIVSGFGDNRSASSGAGLKVHTNGVLVQDGDSVVADNNHDGFRAYHGGVMVLSKGAVASNNDIGFSASYGGVMSVRNTDAYDSGSVGFYSAQGSYLDANGAASARAYRSFYMSSGGVMNANDSSASNGTYGYVSQKGGFLFGQESTCETMSESCYYAEEGAVMSVVDSSSSDAGRYDYTSWTGATVVATGMDMSTYVTNIEAVSSGSDGSFIYD